MTRAFAGIIGLLWFDYDITPELRPEHEPYMNTGQGSPLTVRPPDQARMTRRSSVGDRGVTPWWREVHAVGCAVGGVDILYDPKNHHGLTVPAAQVPPTVGRTSLHTTAGQDKM